VQGAVEQVKSLGRETEESALQKIHTINDAEIEVGHLGDKRGQSAEAREYGKRLAEDHARLDEKVKAMAARLGVDVRPEAELAEVKSLHVKLGAIKKALEVVPASEFDRTFANAMVKTHEDAIAIVRKAQQEVENDELKSMLPEARSSLEAHLERAKQLQKAA
jgi:putative membrane protein